MRRLLLVSYHFGADCPTGGFRWNAIASALSSQGWAVDVITLARPGLRPGGEARGSGPLQIFPVEPVLLPSRVKNGLLSAGRWARARLIRSDGLREDPNATVDPDRLFVWGTHHRRSLRERLLHGLDSLEAASTELVWSGRAQRLAARLILERGHRVVVVSSPPHLTQLVGVRMTTRFGLPYIADFRDPWTLGLGPHAGYLDDVRRIVGRHFETRALRKAHTVIHNTERARLAVAGEFAIPGRHYAIPNGYDSIGEAGWPDPERFRVAYTGHLHPFMDVRTVLAACARLRDRHSLGSKKLRVDFVGTEARFEGVPLERLAESYGLGDVFHIHPRVSREAVARFQESASLLVVFDWLFPIAVPSKFYEYAQMRGAMLLLGNPDGALNDAASELGLAVVDPSDSEKVDQVFDEAFARWQARRFDRPIDRDGRFDRILQSRRIQEILERI